MSHPASALDDTVHQRVRLGILSVISASARAEFGYLREVLDLTDGNLSRHLRVLDQAGYVQIRKGFENARPRTWISITAKGRTAFRAEIAGLRALLAGAGMYDRGRGEVER